MGEAAHVFAADQRDAFAELLLVHLDQPAAVLALFARHLVEDGGGGRKILAQAVGVGGEDVAIGLLGVDGEREDLLLGERRELTTEQSHSPYLNRVAFGPCWGDIARASMTEDGLSRRALSGQVDQPLLENGNSRKSRLLFCLFKLCGAISI